MTKPEDTQSSTVEGAAGYERWRSIDEPHHPDCRCHQCIVDEYEPGDG